MFKKMIMIAIVTTALTSSFAFGDEPCKAAAQSDAKSKDGVADQTGGSQQQGNTNAGSMQQNAPAPAPVTH